MIERFLEEHGLYSGEKSFRELTTIRMGGEIAHYVEPYSREDLLEILTYLKENHIPFKVIGNGSNLICGEGLFDGVVISLRKFNSFEIDNDRVRVEAGVLCPYLANILAKEGLSGFEFASAIPGNIGGLVYMNAGAYKSDMSMLVEEVEAVRRGEIVTLTKEDLDFSYRHSVFQDHPHWIVLSCTMKLTHKEPEEILTLMNSRLQRRKDSQPLDKPSAGSCFRNPEGDFAWKLIDGIGYRGKRINDVSVSEKHSNFIVNEGKGSSKDYLAIVYDIIDRVKEKYGVDLVMEVEKFNC